MSDQIFQIFSIFVGVGLVLIGVLLVVYEFLWWLKITKLRWPLAIICFLLEMATVGVAVYGLIRYCPTMF